MSLKTLVNKVNGNSPLCEGREKGILDNVLGRPIMWRDVDTIAMDGKTVPIVIFDEFPDKYFFGGECFRKIVEAMEETDFEELRNGGLKIQLEKKPQKKNPTRTYTALTLVG